MYNAVMKVPASKRNQPMIAHFIMQLIRLESLRYVLFTLIPIYFHRLMKHYIKLFYFNYQK